MKTNRPLHIFLMFLLCLMEMQLLKAQDAYKFHKRKYVSFANKDFVNNGIKQIVVHGDIYDEDELDTIKYTKRFVFDSTSRLVAVYYQQDGEEEQITATWEYDSRGSVTSSVVWNPDNDDGRERQVWYNYYDVKNNLIRVVLVAEGGYLKPDSAGNYSTDTSYDLTITYSPSGKPIVTSNSEYLLYDSCDKIIGAFNPYNFILGSEQERYFKEKGFSEYKRKYLNQEALDNTIDSAFIPLRESALLINNVPVKQFLSSKRLSGDYIIFEISPDNFLFYRIIN